MRAMDILILSLGVVNGVFMVTGIILNISVVLSFYRSTQLRKRICYFMVLVLSCSDLIVVSVVHLLLLSSIISYYLGKENEQHEFARLAASAFVEGLSLNALFLLNIERFLALSYPFFYQTSVTKRRLIYLLIILMIVLCLAALIAFVSPLVATVMPLIYTTFFLVWFTFLNYKILTVVKAKKDAVAPCGQDVVRPRRSVRKFSTCSLVVVCYFICSSPYMIFSIYKLISENHSLKRKTLPFNLLSCTFVAINSSFNCLLFFWRNSILRREGLKIFKRTKSA